VGFGIKGLIFLSASIFLINLTLAANTVAPEQIDAFYTDVRNASKGGGSLRSPFSHFIYNPAASMMQRRFFMGASYLYEPEVYSFAVSDSKLSRVAGGVFYKFGPHNKHFKMNMALPMGEFMMIGMNFKRFTGNLPGIEESLDSYSFDFGLIGNFAELLSLGVSVIDTVDIGEDKLPTKLNVTGELSFLKNMLSFNSGFVWHWDSEKESYEGARDEVKYSDVFLGAEFTASFLVLSAGVYNSAFSEKLNFSDSAKTFGVTFYKPMIGSISSGFYFKDGEYTFALTLIWEPK